MPPKKELTKHQLSSRLQYQSRTPNFLRAFEARVSGFRGGSAEADSDEDGPQYVNSDDVRPEHAGGHGGKDEFGRDVPSVDEFGREIRRESPPEDPIRGERGKEKAGERAESSEDEEEMPQVVVLKEGKHLSAREVENERRKAKGLPPLPDVDQGPTEKEITSRPITSAISKSTHNQSGITGKTHPQPSKSAVQLGAKVVGTKRKAPVGGRGDEQDKGGPANKKMKHGGGKKDKEKKKAVKGLLSFGDDG